MTDDVESSKTDCIARLAVSDELDHRTKLFGRHIAGGNAGICSRIIEAV
ncbi:MAG TPA: hypothetical protein PLQ15_01735 [Syntrophales bacterium]|nr:hypothetical protein [Syntrophales bacterium]